jgi:hypothetical protein
MLTRILLVVGLLLAPAAHAVCPLDPPQIHVGDTASDAYCHYNDIQSAIDAANAASCPVQINITREHTWGQQHLSVSGKRLIFQGWGDGVTCYALTQCFPLCSPNSTLPLATLDGSATAGRVLTITGNSVVTLRNVRIMRGDAGGGSGGGIAFDGTGFLNLNASDVLLSTAAYGGGINVRGNGGNAQLNLQANTQILNNTASVSGGGVRLEGTARLLATAPQTWIGYNHANGGFGGGVEVIAPARADIGSAGYNGTGVVSYNDAVYGGGISINATDSDTATVRLFTTDPQNPVLVAQNAASSRGGGVYLDVTGIPSATLCAYDFRIDDNLAPDGAAIYADYDPGVFADDGSDVHFNTGLSNNPACGPESLPSLGAVDCAAGVPCNELARNRAATINAVPTDGAVVTLDSTSTLEGDPVAFRDNTAANVLRLVGNTYDGFDAVLRNCLVAGNHTQHELISVRGGRDLGINGCTIAGNTIDNGYSIYANVGDAGLRLVNSIVDQPGRSVLDYVGSNGLRNLDFLIANETFTLGGAQHTQGNTPVYVDAAGGDFHLAAGSPGLDFAPAQGGLDLDGKPRTVDLAGTANLYGPRDLGGYERQDGTVVDVLFQDGFE